MPQVCRTVIATVIVIVIAIAVLSSFLPLNLPSLASAVCIYVWAWVCVCVFKQGGCLLRGRIPSKSTCPPTYPFSVFPLFMALLPAVSSVAFGTSSGCNRQIVPHGTNKSHVHITRRSPPSLQPSPESISSAVATGNGPWASPNPTSCPAPQPRSVPSIRARTLPFRLRHLHHLQYHADDSLDLGHQTP